MARVGSETIGFPPAWVISTELRGKARRKFWMGPESRKSGWAREQRNRPTWTRRSEEHTSELQSPCNLVCRLLLEKKKVRILFSASWSDRICTCSQLSALRRS